MLIILQTAHTEANEEKPVPEPEIDTRTGPRAQSPSLPEYNPKDREGQEDKEGSGSKAAASKGKPGPNGEGEEDDFETLAKRFAALKKR